MDLSESSCARPTAVIGSVEEVKLYTKNMNTLKKDKNIQPFNGLIYTVESSNTKKKLHDENDWVSQTGNKNGGIEVNNHF